MPFEFIDHTADAAMRLRAPDSTGLLEAATAGLLSLYTGSNRSHGRQAATADEAMSRHSLRLDASDGEGLIVTYLNELIYLFDTQGLLTVAIDIDQLKLAEPALLVASITCRRWDPGHEILATEVKAATYHDIAIKRDAEGLSVDVVFDL